MYPFDKVCLSWDFCTSFSMNLKVRACVFWLNMKYIYSGGDDLFFGLFQWCGREKWVPKVSQKTWRKVADRAREENVFLPYTKTTSFRFVGLIFKTMSFWLTRKFLFFQQGPPSFLPFPFRSLTFYFIFIFIQFWPFSQYFFQFIP